jgi:hypothetical protein
MTCHFLCNHPGVHCLWTSGIITCAQWTTGCIAAFQESV